MSLIKAFNGIRAGNSHAINIENHCIYPKIYHPIIAENNTAYELEILAMLSNHIFLREQQPCFYLHRITSNSMATLGLIAIADIDALHTKILLHELTLPAKEKTYFNSFNDTHLQTNPVLLTYRHVHSLDCYLQNITLLRPDIDIQSVGVHYQIWKINNIRTLKQLTVELNQIEIFCVADGHHRLTALKAYFNNHNINDNRSFLSILISEKYIHLKSYHRVIYGYEHLTNLAFIHQLGKKFYIQTIQKPMTQPNRGEFLIYLKKQWLKLTVKPGAIMNSEITPFDPIIADNFIFSDIFGIHDQTHSNIDFIHENHSMDYYQNFVDIHCAKAVICIPRLTLFDFFTIVTKRIILPPNSTCFEPKLLNGLISYLIH